jgi:hypothetical protein
VPPRRPSRLRSPLLTGEQFSPNSNVWEAGRPNVPDEGMIDFNAVVAPIIDAQQT